MLCSRKKSKAIDKTVAPESDESHQARKIDDVRHNSGSESDEQKFQLSYRAFKFYWSGMEGIICSRIGNAFFGQTDMATLDSQLSY